MKYFFFLALAINFSSVSAQTPELTYYENNFGFQIGANFAFGTHIQRMGLTLNFFYSNDFIQFNSEARFYRNLKNLGPSRSHNEMVLAQGVLFSFGKKQNYFNPFLNSVSNQTFRNNSVAYSYNFYFNKIKTKQVTGIISLQFGSISVLTENDLLAKQVLDRFRTGAILVRYQYKDLYQAGINCTLWTGEMGHSVTDSSFKSHCYIDTTGGKYTNYSHGILSAEFKYNIGVMQIVQLNTGVDAEQIRNMVQNKLTHDVLYRPNSKYKSYNCHIPMLDSKGQQYLYKPYQKIKKPKAFINAYVNGSTFY